MSRGETTGRSDPGLWRVRSRREVVLEHRRTVVCVEEEEEEEPSQGRQEEVVLGSIGTTDSGSATKQPRSALPDDRSRRGHSSTPRGRCLLTAPPLARHNSLHFQALFFFFFQFFPQLSELYSFKLADVDEALSLPSRQTEPRLVVTLLLVVDVVVVAMTAAPEADEGKVLPHCVLWLAHVRRCSEVTWSEGSPATGKLDGTKRPEGKRTLQAWIQEE